MPDKKSPAKQRVLVVDDCQSMRCLIKMAFQDIGFTSVTEARDGKEALKLFKQCKADIIVCDWNMPNMDGLELLKQLRPSPLDRSFRFLLATSEDDPKKTKEAIALGVDDIITKPFQLSELAKRISQLIKSTINFPIPAASMHVVVVEDMPVILSMLTEMLLAQGFKQTTPFSDPNEALTHIQNNKVDLIFSDWKMPNMSGLELHAALQEDPKTKPIPFILITAEGDIEKIRDAISAGVDGYLVKPFYPDALARETFRVYKLSTNV